MRPNILTSLIDIITTHVGLTDSLGELIEMRQDAPTTAKNGRRVPTMTVKATCSVTSATRYGVLELMTRVRVPDMDTTTFQGVHHESQGHWYN